MNLFVKNKYLILALMALTWGSSFILIKKTLPVFSPLQIGAFRVGFSGVLLFIVGWRALKNLSKKDLFWLALTGLMGNFIPLFLVPFAQTRVSSSLTGIIGALEPIFALVLGYILFKIPTRSAQVAGAFIGFFGAAVLLYFSDQSHSRNYLFYTFILILTALLYAGAALLVQAKLRHVKPVQLSGAIYTLWMLPSLFILTSTGFFTKTDFQATLTWNALAQLLFLTVISTTLAMLLFYKLIQETTAVFASSVSFLIPVVAVLWGVLDGEDFVVWYAVGGLLILIGIYLIREKRP